jgi:RNA polymerase sigma factor (sigma-70 family)
MTTSQMSGFIQHLRRAVLLPDGVGMTDGQLLEDYISRRDEAALAALVRRHGPMVWGVCRRVLRNYHDAEDAFQATFLVLVRRAASIASRKLVANWLYGVAHQTALKARATAAKKNMRERQVTEMPQPAVAEQDLWNDLQPLLDEELTRLPDKYRVVIVLCDLEGKTRKEAARQLGCPEGTVAGRLARARALLAKRLSQRGVALSGGALAAVLAQQAASAGVPYSVVDSTIKAASLLAAGKAAATGAISVKVAALTEGVMKAMLFSKLRAALAVVLILGFVATGATILTCRTAAGQDDKKAAAEKPVEPAAKQEKEKETFTAWGKEVGGLQAGLGFRPGEKRVHSLGETVKLVVRVRNVGKEEVTFNYIPAYFVDWPPSVTDGDGKTGPQIRFPGKGGDYNQVKVNLAPGKEIELAEVKLELRPASERDNKKENTLYGTGKFQIHYERLMYSSGAVAIASILRALATGKLDLEIKEGEPAKPPQKQEQKQEKEGFTAWGKEVGGLQAGLGFRPGEKRAYHHGEAVAVVLRVRNVGKEAVEFNHIGAFFVENPPTITGADGKVIQLPIHTVEGKHGPSSPNVAPGKEIELYEWGFDLRPQGESGNKGSLTIHGSGKFSLQCERIVGPTSFNPNHPNPAMSKLATGKLELEIKEEVKSPPNQDQKQETETFTAWGKEVVGRGLHMGKEVDGLQAGLGFRPGEKRAYSHGETVKLVVRVRNIGKKEVTFKYIPAYFFDSPPSLTDGEGKAAPQLRLPSDGHEGEYNPKELTLAPGKEVELAEVRIELRPASESGNKKVNTLYGTGKFQIHYERLMYSSGRLDIGSILSDLATGKLELEIKPAPPAEKK